MYGCRVTSWHRGRLGRAKHGELVRVTGASNFGTWLDYPPPPFSRTLLFAPGPLQARLPTRPVAIRTSVAVPKFPEDSRWSRNSGAFAPPREGRAESRTCTRKLALQNFELRYTLQNRERSISSEPRDC